jgi:predicted nucleic acid-binding protein
VIEDLSHELVERSREVMRRYADHPMDLADATLVALAEAGELRRIFTLGR